MSSPSTTPSASIASRGEREGAPAPTTMRAAPLALASAVVALLAVAVVASLEAYGRSRRVAGPGHELAPGRVPILAVQSPDDAYREWSRRGFRGRLVVSLGARLYFVDPPPLPAPTRDGRPLDLAARVERALDARNFLFVALERGVVREVRHVLPRRTFEEKAEAARGEPRTHVSHDAVSAPHGGSPRLLTTLDHLPPSAEPVLVFVSASIFADRDAAAVWRALAKSGLRTDLAVLCESREDPDVTAAEREELARFARLLGGE